MFPTVGSQELPSPSNPHEQYSAETMPPAIVDDLSEDSLILAISPISELCEFTGERDLDPPLLDASTSSAPAEEGISLLADTPLPIGLRFYHASGKSFILCEDGVIREIYQPPVTLINDTSSSVSTTPEADPYNGVENFNFESIAVADPNPVEAMGLDFAELTL